MTNQHQHNPAIFIILRSGAIAFGIAVVVAAGYVTFISATGALFNPIFRVPAWLFDFFLDLHVPYSTRDFKLLEGVSGIDSLGKTIGNALFLIIASACTFSLIINTGFYIASSVNEYALKYKLGSEGAAAYMKEQQEKHEVESQEQKLLSDMETARREHYEKWKKTFKSGLSYDEWIKRFSL